MRGSAAVQVTVANFTVWRSSLAFVGLTVMAVWVCWLLQGGASAPFLAVGMAAVCGVVVWLLGPLLRVEPVSLGWDGGSWWISSGEAASGRVESGVVEVHLDLGAWLLLRFFPVAGATRGGSLWLPVQRQGTAPDWHALRCALYAPQPDNRFPAAERGEAGP